MELVWSNGATYRGTQSQSGGTLHGLHTHKLYMHEGYSKTIWSNLWSNLKWNLYLTIFAWFKFIPVRDIMNQEKSEDGDFLKIIVYTQARITRKIF